jgi:hypothetical protein
MRYLDVVLDANTAKSFHVSPSVVSHDW